MCVCVEEGGEQGKGGGCTTVTARGHYPWSAQAISKEDLVVCMPVAQDCTGGCGGGGKGGERPSKESI